MRRWRSCYPEPWWCCWAPQRSRSPLPGCAGFADIFGPMFLALVLTIAVHPLRSWLHGKGLPGWASTVITIITVYVFLIGFVVALVVATAQFASLLPQYKDEMTSTVNDVTSWLTHLGVDQKQINAIADSFDAGKLVDLAGDVLGSLLGVVSDLFFIVTLVLFLGFDGAWFPGRLSGDVQGARAARLGAGVVRRRNPELPGGLHGLRTDRGGHRHRGAVGDGHPGPAPVGDAGLHHQLHPQHRLHHRSGAGRDPGPARGRGRPDARGHRGVLRDQRGDPVGHPAEGGRRRGRPVIHAHASSR